ncbi:MDR family oxidoreductase [Radicibacter daui]|uniref:MDR family oxidoreductase n=1 Tax=Radicibacter daui TaxID=3064829 RepID=UPI00404700A2
MRALILREEAGAVSAAIESVDEALLPGGDVVIDVDYSTLNYKDGMILKGLGRLVRQYPHVPGVDFSGRIASSGHPDFNPGDAVILTGWRVGEMRWGGFADKARVKGEWLVPVPTGMTRRQSMALGTAGLTAMLAIMTLEEHGLEPSAGPVLVTGAAGGVGSVATVLLAQAGYQVACSTGRQETHDYLRSLGAGEIIDRKELEEASARPLETERWAACIDNVGGSTLARVLGQMKYRGGVAAVGMTGGNMMTASVLPFLLRGVRLLGIDSVMIPVERRRAAWRRLADEMPTTLLDGMTTEITLGEVVGAAEAILAGQVKGRIVIDVRR